MPHARSCEAHTWAIRAPLLAFPGVPMKSIAASNAVLRERALTDARITSSCVKVQHGSL